ncbi:MAG TPA: hypothetical protein V6D30_20235 [Leptolyngbyaceae cyanobacterium]
MSCRQDTPDDFLVTRHIHKKMQPHTPSTDWQKEGLEKIFKEAEDHPSPANKTRVQVMYGQLGSGLYLHEVDEYTAYST